MTADALLAMRPYLSLVHHVPGRLRLRLVPALGARWSLDARSARTRILQALPGVRDVRINLAAASIVLEYDPAVVTPDLWESLLEGTDDEATRALASMLRPAGGAGVAGRRVETEEPTHPEAAHE